MKYSLFLLFLMIFGRHLLAQDTLREENSVMYSKYYVLHEDGKFEYFFHHCTGTTYGRGVYKKGISRWKFKYDSLQIPALSYKCASNDISNDSITIILKRSIDSTLFNPYLIGVNTIGYTGVSKISVPKSEFSTDTIHVSYEGHQLTFEIDKINCDLITLFLQDNWITIAEYSKEIFIKKNDGLYRRQKSPLPNDDSPWKRNKRVWYSYRYTLN